MQLTASFVYMLDDSVQLPEDTSKVYEVPLYVSELYDKAGSTDPNAKKLNQIYIMYSPSVEEEALYGAGKDIRLLDATNPEDKALNASIYIANQVVGENPTSVDTAIGIGGLANRAGATNKIRISLKDPETDTLREPVGGKIYCSCDVEVEPTASVVAFEKNSLVAKGEEVRIVTTTVEIKDSTGQDTLATKTITLLQ